MEYRKPVAEFERIAESLFLAVDRHFVAADREHDGLFIDSLQGELAGITVPFMIETERRVEASAFVSLTDHFIIAVIKHLDLEGERKLGAVDLDRRCGGFVLSREVHELDERDFKRTGLCLRIDAEAGNDARPLRARGHVDVVIDKLVGFGDCSRLVLGVIHGRFCGRCKEDFKACLFAVLHADMENRSVCCIEGFKVLRGNRIVANRA